jgi:hypothetical protein
MTRTTSWFSLCLGFFLLMIFCFDLKAQEIDQSLYNQQLKGYKKLYSSHQQMEEEEFRLRREIERRQEKYEHLQEKARKWDEKAAAALMKQREAAQLALDYENQIKQLEEKAVAGQEQFWKEQENYQIYQDRYENLKKEQMKAATRAKKLRRTEQGEAQKVAKFKQQQKILLSEAEVVKKQIQDINRPVDILPKPRAASRSRRLAGE